jgi:hypothetical protein
MHTDPKWLQHRFLLMIMPKKVICQDNSVGAISQKNVWTVDAYQNGLIS